MTAGGCTPSGCQCQCHNPPTGIEIKHLVPCCNPADELTTETERLGLYDNLHIQDKADRPAQSRKLM